jgi:putative methionine-R-sulfoxide reductase with GAF domain
LNSGDVLKLKGYFPAVPETKSELVVPIRSGGIVLGVINSESEKPNHFTVSIQEKVEELADALGTLLPILHWNPRAKESEIPWIQKSPEAITITSS